MTRDYQSHDIYLSDDERRVLMQFAADCGNPQMIVRRAKVILLVDRNGRRPLSSKDVASLLGIGPVSVTRIKTDYIDSEDVSSFLQRKKRETPPREVKVTEEVQKKIIALCEQDPPSGHLRWTLNLLADKAVELGYVDSIGKSSVWLVLKRAGINLA